METNFRESRKLTDIVFKESMQIRTLIYSRILKTIIIITSRVDEARDKLKVWIKEFQWLNDSFGCKGKTKAKEEMIGIHWKQ